MQSEFQLRPISGNFGLGTASSEYGEPENRNEDFEGGFHGYISRSCQNCPARQFPFLGGRPGLQLRQTRTRLLSGAAANQLAELEHHGISNGIKNVKAFTPTRNQSALQQRLQMAGDIGLAALQRVHDFSDWQFAGLQHLKNAETHRLAEQAESLGDQLGHGAGKSKLWCGLHMYNYITT